MGRTRGDHPENLRLLGGIHSREQTQPASRANPNHYSHETRGRIEMPIDEVGEGSLPAKGAYGSIFLNENGKGN